MTATYCRCGRLDQHDPHYWEGHKRYLWRFGWVKPRYWCAGYVTTEGGWHGHAR